MRKLPARWEPARPPLKREKEEKARARDAKRTVDKPAPAASQPAAAEPARDAKPASAPPPPVLSGSKEEKLKQLLEAYRTGAIPAVEYHRERAKLLGQ